MSGRTILTVAKNANDASDQFGEGADQEDEEGDARPEDADTFGSGEPLASVASFTSTDVENDDEATAPADAAEPLGPLDSDDRAATGSEADDADDSEEPSPLRDLADADADELEAEDLGGLEA